MLTHFLNSSFLELCFIGTNTFTISCKLFNWFSSPWNLENTCTNLSCTLKHHINHKPIVQIPTGRKKASRIFVCPSLWSPKQNKRFLFMLLHFLFAVMAFLVWLPQQQPTKKEDNSASESALLWAINILCISLCL